MPKTHEQDLLVVRNVLSVDFTENWGGQPFTVPANGEKVYPRFIAEHLAKHMTNAAIFQKEKDMAVAQGVQRLKHSFLNNEAMRAEIMAKALPEVYQYYLEQPKQTEEERIAEQIEKASAAYANRETPNTPPAEVPVDQMPDKPAEPDPDTGGTTAEVSLLDPKKKKPTKAQLIEDCEQLGIELTGDESYTELVAKIKEF